MAHLFSFFFLLSLCFPVRGLTATATVDMAPSIECIEEMQPWPSEFGPLSAGFLDPELKNTVEAQWQPLAASVAAALTPEVLQRISHWSKAEMATCTVTEEQLSHLPFVQVAQTAEREQILYSQDVEEGIALPSHHPLVFRRLLVALAFAPQAQRITRVFVTIRGRREE